MNRITKRVSAACLALLMTASAGASSLPFSFSESKAVIVASAEDAPEYSEAEAHYREVLAAALAVNPDDYSADSYAMFTKRLSEYDVSIVFSMYNNPYTDYEYNKLCEGIAYSKTFLVSDKTHSYYNDLAALIEKGDNLNKNDYTEESYEAFKAQFDTLKNGNFSLEKAAGLTDHTNIYENYILKTIIPALHYLKIKTTRR